MSTEAPTTTVLDTTKCKCRCKTSIIALQTSLRADGSELDLDLDSTEPKLQHLKSPGVQFMNHFTDLQ